MAKRQNPFGGGPRIGNAAPGEPAPTPSAEGLAGFGNAPTINAHFNRGAKQVNPVTTDEVHPTPYGGGNAFVKRPNTAPASGSGDGTGAGATSGSSQHGGTGIP